MPSVFFILVLFAAPCVASTTRSVTVAHNNGQYSLIEGIVPSPHTAAIGHFQDGLNTTGWGVLDIKSTKGQPDAAQFFAVGFAEGALTAPDIYANVINLRQIFFNGQTPSQRVTQFFDTQQDWTTTQVKNNPSSPYWQQVGLIMAQFEGLVAGYASVNNTAGWKPLTLFDFQMLQGTGDLLDLLSALSPETAPQWHNMTHQQFEEALFKRSLCSGLIKVNTNLTDMFSAHSSWFTFSATNRIYKNYYFDVAADFVAAKGMSFSSYPGFLESLDDFYQMDSGLVMVQTTNSIFNQKLYELVKPQSLFAWQRVRLASSMATNTSEWCQLIKPFNSGTYNNQYMVVDYGRFETGKPLKNGTLWVCEQIPGLIEDGDMTSVLERGYFASYNVPTFPVIYQRSGYPEMVEKYGVSVSYDLAPRAQIFRRDQDKVVDLESFKSIMRYNDYKFDPVANGDPTAAICARGDLRHSNPSPSGCYDTKVTNVRLHRTLTSHAINGPTYGKYTGKSAIPPFSWSESGGVFESDPHLGLPNTYTFDFIPITPRWMQEDPNPGAPLPK